MSVCRELRRGVVMFSVFWVYQLRGWVFYRGKLRWDEVTWGEIRGDEMRGVAS